MKIGSQFYLDYLPESRYPDSKIYNQIVRLHKPDGGINVDTWKYCVEVSEAMRLKEDPAAVDEYKKTDIVFDKYFGHYAYIIRDDDFKVYAWGFFLLGQFRKEFGTHIKHASIQFFTRQSERGKGFGSTLFSEAIDLAKLNRIQFLFYYAANDNKWFFHKMKERYRGNGIILKNIYKDLDVFL